MRSFADIIMDGPPSMKELKNFIRPSSTYPSRYQPLTIHRTPAARRREQAKEELCIRLTWWVFQGEAICESLKEKYQRIDDINILRILDVHEESIYQAFQEWATAEFSDSVLQLAQRLAHKNGGCQTKKNDVSHRRFDRLIKRLASSLCRSTSSPRGRTIHSNKTSFLAGNACGLHKFSSSDNNQQNKSRKGK